MDALKGLKAALVLVLVVGSALLAWTTYLERKQNRQIEDFSNAVSQVKSEAEARTIIKNFLADTEKLDLGNSADADYLSCRWLCETK